MSVHADILPVPCSETLVPLDTVLARNQTECYRVKPLTDPRWDELVERHPRASVFHSRPWLEALSRTYGYDAEAFSTSPPAGDLENALVFCHVESWLTGRRWVSLPFSDHCEPLVDDPLELQLLLNRALKEAARADCRYVEMRPLQPTPPRTPCPCSSVSYAFHQLDLTPSLDDLFDRFHKSSTQRKVRRAERERLTYAEGSSELLLDSFYPLFRMTRFRHNLPAQPREWFSNLISSFGKALKIRVARKDGRAVAAMLTLQFKDTMVYKYGCSDARQNRFGGTHLLFWKSIEEAKSRGLRFLDFGRTDLNQPGLMTFKRRWGAAQSSLTYARYAVSGDSTHFLDLPAPGWRSKTARQVMALLPLSALDVVGDFLYKHVG